MNDMVSIKKMRPCDPAVEEDEDREEETDGSWAALFAAVAGPGSGDFFRGGNPLSVAAGKPLKIDPEIGLHQLPYFPRCAIAEDEVVPGGPVERRRKSEVHFLIVSIVCGKRRFVRASVD